MSYTVKDTLGILTATVALAPVLFAPGYLAGWAFHLFDFRQRRPVLRLILGVPLTIAISPIVVYLLARFLPAGLWIFYGASTIGCLWLLARAARTLAHSKIPRYTWLGLGMIAGWIMVAIASLVDLQLGTNLYLPIPAFDHATRVAMMGAIERNMPPSNPFFAANPGIPLRYHYLWILLVSLPSKVGQFPLRDLTYAGVVWCGIGLICLVALAMKFLAGVQSRIEQKVLLAVSLLCVTGLDLLPTLYMAASDKTWQADLEWWNEVQISSWAASLLWVPHHLAALIACVIGFLLLRKAGEEGRRGQAGAVVIAGIAFASAAGLSVYVTFTFVVAIGLWMMVLAAHKNWREAAMFAAAGAVAAIVAWPFLHSMESAAQRGSGFLEFALRPFPLGIHLVAKLGFALRDPSAIAAVNALGLPFNYLLELGFFLAIAAIRFRQLKRGFVRITSNELAGWVLIATGFILGSFVRSSTIETNDLGTRCFLPAQLILLIWAGIFVDDWLFAKTTPIALPGPLARAVLSLLLMLGILGTIYELAMFRYFPVLKDRGTIEGVMLLDIAPKAGQRTFALRSLYEQLNKELPRNAVIQNNPRTRNLVTNLIYSGHQSVAGDPGCGATFGGDNALCAERVRRLTLLYQLPDDDPQSACAEYGIDVMIVQDTDPVWHDRSSWVWSREPLVANDYARAFRCGVTMAGGN